MKFPTRTPRLGEWLPVFLQERYLAEIIQKLDSQNKNASLN